MAAELYNKSLDILTVQFGDAHPEASISSCDLKLYPLSFGEIRLTCIDFTQVANNQSFLARLYVSLGRYKEAEAMFSAAQDTHVQRLGPAHPRTARILADMADLYRICGRVRNYVVLFLCLFRYHQWFVLLVLLCCL